MPYPALVTEGCLIKHLRYGAGSGGRGMTRCRRCDTTAGGPSREASGASVARRRALTASGRRFVRNLQPECLAFPRVVGPHGGVNSPTTGHSAEQASNTARGTPSDLVDLRNTLRSAQARRRADFDKPRCREASRPAGPSGPLASRAPSVLSRAAAGDIRRRPAPQRIGAAERWLFHSASCAGLTRASMMKVSTGKLTASLVARPHALPGQTRQ